jgi:pimeloyl-ACP methyl ester carboxylesterase
MKFHFFFPLIHTKHTNTNTIKKNKQNKMGAVVDRFVFPAPPLHFPSSRSAVQAARAAGGTWTLLRPEDPEHSVSMVCFGTGLAAPAILFCHGNHEDLSSVWMVAHGWSTSLSCPVYAFDYTGYGLSGLGTAQRPSQAGLEASAWTACSHVCTRHAHVVVVGFSLGTVAAVYLGTLAGTSLPQVGHIVLAAPMVSLTAVVLKSTMAVPWNMLDNASRLPLVTCPVHIVHGMEDEVIPVWHGVYLAQYATRFYQVPDTGHNNILATAEFAQCVRLAVMHADTTEKKGGV